MSDSLRPPWTVAAQAPPSMGFSRQEYWSGLPFIQSFNSVQSLSRVQLCDPMNTVRQASLSITNSRSLLKLMYNESVMPSSHLILCHPLFLPPSIFPSIRVFSNESALRIGGKVLGFPFQQILLLDKTTDMKYLGKMLVGDWHAWKTQWHRYPFIVSCLNLKDGGALELRQLLQPFGPF